MTAAYLEAEGDGHSTDLVKLRLIERFGVKAVLGREALYGRDVYRMLTAERVYHAKRANMDSENWAEWAKNNPDSAELLAKVEKIING